MRRPPCKQCEDRQPGCQDRCQRMKDWQEEKNAEKKYLAEEKRSTLSENGKRELWKNMRYGRQNRRHTA